MVSLIFDDKGQCWDRGSHAFRKAFHVAWLKEDPCPFLIGQGGFIGVALRSAAPMIRFNPRTVAAPALVRLHHWVSQQPCERLCLAYDGDDRGVAHKIVGPSLKALQDVQALIEQASGPQLPFTSVSDRLENLGNLVAFAALFEHWCTSGGIFEEAVYGPLLNRFARNRYIVFSPRSSAGDLKIVKVGEGLHIPDKQSHARLAGTQLVDVADQAYGQWTSGIYRGVLESKAPRFDQIYAKIHWPSVGQVDRSYWRLILPCRARDGQHLLLGVSCDPGPLDDLDRKVA